MVPRRLPRLSLGACFFPSCWSESCQSAFLGGFLLLLLPCPLRVALCLCLLGSPSGLPPPLWRPTRKEGGSPGRPSDSVAVRSFMQGGGEAQLCRFVSHLSGRHSPISCTCRAPTPPSLPAPPCRVVSAGRRAGSAPYCFFRDLFFFPRQVSSFFDELSLRLR